MLQEGDMRPNQVKLIAKQLGVTEQDVIDMNLAGLAVTPRSTHRSVKEDGDTGEWQDQLVDRLASQETMLAEERRVRQPPRRRLASALSVLNNRERRIFEGRRLTEEQIRVQGTRRRVRRLARAHCARLTTTSVRRVAERRSRTASP